MSVYVVLCSVLAAFAISLLFSPLILRSLARLVGYFLSKASQGRRELLLTRTALEKENYAHQSGSGSPTEDEDWERVENNTAGTAHNGEKTDKDWDGFVGFFHPFCNAGGGGERVLWAAIRATQKRWPGAICIVYTGDHDVDKSAMLERVKDRFNIHIYSPTIHFQYLTTRRYVLSTTWPHFTLLGQSIGSLILADDAFSLLVPDIFVDTMGYAFAVGLCHYFFPHVPTGAYVHYPTISTDMLGSLSKGGQGINAGTGEGFRGIVKRKYWHLFAHLYSWIGGSIDVVMANSTWTQTHIQQLWGPNRSSKGKTTSIDTLFPPCAVEEVAKQTPLSETSEAARTPSILYIAQFRPEKNHTLIVEAFAQLLHNSPPSSDPSTPPKLILIGSVRDGDDASRVYQLRLLAHELKINDSVEFICDASWPQILAWLRRASVGVNGMWNEHFGIGVVEYQAAGLIAVVNDSGGPKLDIVVDVDGAPTGFHASSAAEYADGFARVLGMGSGERLAMRRRARRSAERFTERAFARGWVRQMEVLVGMQRERRRK